MGIEVYLQTTFGSPAFNSGTQPSMNLLFDQSLPLGIGFEYNFGIAGVQNGLGRDRLRVQFRVVVSARGGQGLRYLRPRFLQSIGPAPTAFPSIGDLGSQAAIPAANVVGIGAIKTINDHLAVFGSYNFGTTSGSPHTIALTGFAVAF